MIWCYRLAAQYCWTGSVVQMVKGLQLTQVHCLIKGLKRHGYTGYIVVMKDGGKVRNQFKSVENNSYSSFGMGLFRLDMNV